MCDMEPQTQPRDYKKEWRLRNLEKVRKSQNERQKKWRRENPEKARARDKAMHLKRKEKEKLYMKTYEYKRDPIKKAARILLNNAIKTGKVIKPEKCERCEATVIEGHHPDYNFPLSVIWLCKPCHELEHHPINI